jgi:hypothetical protein
MRAAPLRHDDVSKSSRARQDSVTPPGDTDPTPKLFDDSRRKADRRHRAEVTKMMTNITSRIIGGSIVAMVAAGYTLSLMQLSGMSV